MGWGRGGSESGVIGQVYQAQPIRGGGGGGLVRTDSKLRFVWGED